ncbi:hypothetical protein PG999_008534 [Apiospora kogelbergensis]|uniref:Clr5 domain-containing protein n=1 Tax=Apiospora kogelbergensis TaxID=1337665 RepID=A0AAW0QM17_9PEZI
MAEIFIQCTGQPPQRQPPRIPRVRWEERKPHIIRLYENHTLDEVVEKMAESGFKASRRQYIYQLGEWGITKYNVTLTSSSNGAFNNKRKQSAAATEHADDNRNKTSSQATSSHKKPKVDEQRMTCPDEESGGQQVATAANDHERASPASDNHGTTSPQARSPQKSPKVDEQWTTSPEEGAERHQAVTDDSERGSPALVGINDVTASSNLQPATKPIPLGFGVIATTFGDLFRLLTSSRDDWYASRENLRIAHEVSLSARQVRMRPYENRGDVNEFCRHRLYLQDIGEYLWGIKMCEEAYDIYALMLESSNKDTYMKALLPCARSANTHEAYLWLASFLQGKTPHIGTPMETWDALILAHLILARKLLKCGRQDPGKLYAKSALHLRRLADCSLSGRQAVAWTTIHAVQDWYFLEIGYECDLDIGAPGTPSESLWNHQSWTYSQLDEALSRETEGFDEFSTSVTLFKFLWRAGFGSPRESPRSAPGRSLLSARAFWPMQSRSSASRWSAWEETSRVLGTTIPHFVGACCDLLTFLVSKHAKTPWARIDDFRDVDLVEIVSDTDVHQLYSDFVRVYCNRDSGLRSGETGELLLSPSYQCNPQRQWISRVKIPPYAHPEVYQSPKENTNMGGAAAVDTADHSSSNITVSTSAQQCSTSRGSVDNYSLNPTWVSSCRSSLSSYEDMKKARAAMAMHLKAAKHLHEKPLIKKPLYEEPLYEKPFYEKPEFIQCT